MEDETAGQAILNFIESAVLDHCDELDGVKDGLIENPLTCDFDITTLACDPTAANSTQCLSTSQIAAFQKIYDGPRNTTGHSLYPGFTFGSENELIQQTSGSLSNSFTASILQNVVFDNLSYDLNLFDWDADVALIDQRVGTLIDEISPDLSAFRARGGKLLVTQAWADPYNAATWPIDHKKQLEDAMGGDVSDWFSLFMLPGTSYLPPIEFAGPAPVSLVRLTKCRRRSLRGNAQTQVNTAGASLIGEARRVGREGGRAAGHALQQPTGWW